MGYMWSGRTDDHDIPPGPSPPGRELYRPRLYPLVGRSRVRGGAGPHGSVGTSWTAPAAGCANPRVEQPGVPPVPRGTAARHCGSMTTYMAAPPQSGKPGRCSSFWELEKGGPVRRIVHSAAALGVAVAAVSASAVALAGPADAVSPNWYIMQRPVLPAAAPDNVLSAISCPSPGACVATGSEGYSASQTSLVETLRKGTWRVTPSPGTSAAFPVDFLSSVACMSISSCMAVGWATDTKEVNERTLVETLSGDNWKVSPSPNPSTASNNLNGVSCPSRTACVAVGDDGTTSSQKTLIETLVGNSWKLTPSPSTPSPFPVDFLTGVSCSSSTHCVAAGFAAGSTAMESRALIETLNDGTWTITPSPNSGSPINELYGVWCSSSASCVAVGDTGTIYTQTPLVETLSRGKWRVTPSPSTPLPLNTLFQSWCRSSTSCVATGYAMNSGGTKAKTLIEYLNGRSWTIVPSPNSNNALNELLGYACSSATSCYAVGVQGNGNAHQALIETTSELH